jgi:hypothetical protein
VTTENDEGPEPVRVIAGSTKFRIIAVGARYLVSVVCRPKRQWPYNLRIRDRLAGRIVEEVVRGVTIRHRAEAYARAAKRREFLNADDARRRGT